MRKKYTFEPLQCFPFRLRVPSSFIPAGFDELGDCLRNLRQLRIERFSHVFSGSSLNLADSLDSTGFLTVDTRSYITWSLTSISQLAKMERITPLATLLQLALTQPKMARFSFILAFMSSVRSEAGSP
jgi:hypothetical protein